MDRSRKCAKCSEGTRNKKIVCIDCHAKTVEKLAGKIRELQGKVLTEQTGKSLMQLFLAGAVEKNQGSPERPPEPHLKVGAA